MFLALVSSERCQVLPQPVLHRLRGQVGQGADLGHRQQGAHPQERVPAHLRTHQGPGLVARQSGIAIIN